MNRPSWFMHVSSFLSVHMPFFFILMEQSVLEHPRLTCVQYKCDACAWLQVAQPCKLQAGQRSWRQACMRCISSTKWHALVQDWVIVLVEKLSLVSVVLVSQPGQPIPD
jgi:hypothetical protein